MSGLFSTPKAPPVQPPAPMPVPDTVITSKNKKAATLAAQQRTGRSSTIMTDYGVAGKDKFGG